MTVPGFRRGKIKDLETINLICKRYCPYYKDGKEDIACGAFKFISNLIKRKTLNPAVFKIKKESLTYRFDNLLMDIICNRCKFREDDCDYRGGRPDAPPCGGYVLLSLLLEKEVLNEKAIS